MSEIMIKVILWAMPWIYMIIVYHFPLRGDDFENKVLAFLGAIFLYVSFIYNEVTVNKK